jgi:threonine synthase
MMTTEQDENVHALAIEGTFDDCQAIVKGMFNHHGFRDRVGLSGVNSINWARIVAQVVTTSPPRWRSVRLRAVDFTVPTGSFGDIFAGYVAKLGLPSACGSPQYQRHPARTLKTGIYRCGGPRLRCPR